MSGPAMPGGDPGLLEQLAAQLEAVAEGSGNLGVSTRQATTAIRSDAEWSGDAADAYTAFTGDLAQGVVATQAPLSRIAEAVRGYAGSYARHSKRSRHTGRPRKWLKSAATTAAM